MTLYAGAKVRVTDYPMTKPGDYPIGEVGVVKRVLDELPYFEVELDKDNYPFCDGHIVVLGTEIEALPITSPDAEDAAKGDGTAGVPS